jgi:hypothetical protein
MGKEDVTHLVALYTTSHPEAVTSEGCQVSASTPRPLDAEGAVLRQYWSTFR